MTSANSPRSTDYKTENRLSIRHSSAEIQRSKVTIFWTISQFHAHAQWGFLLSGRVFGAVKLCCALVDLLHSLFTICEPTEPWIRVLWTTSGFSEIWKFEPRSPAIKPKPFERKRNYAFVWTSSWLEWTNNFQQQCWWYSEVLTFISMSTRPWSSKSPTAHAHKTGWSFKKV